MHWSLLLQVGGLGTAAGAAAAAASPETAPFWPSLGIGGGIALAVIGFWRVERKESQDRYAALAKDSQERYAQLAKESQDRYAVLAKDSQERYAEFAKEATAETAAIAADFRNIVQENTAAMTAVGEKLVSGDGLTVRMLVELLKKTKGVNIE